MIVVDAMREKGWGLSMSAASNNCIDIRFEHLMRHHGSCGRGDWRSGQERRAILEAALIAVESAE